MDDLRAVKKHFQTLVNIGPATAQDLIDLGFRQLEELGEQDPLEMYKRLCSLTGVRHDPCVLDVFMATVHNVRTGERRVWWEFTSERKMRYRGSALTWPVK